jgi:hypothetical protein
MEHTLHAAIVAQLLWLLVERTAHPWRRGRAAVWYGLLAAGTLLRFETIFFAAGAALALVVIARHQRAEAAAGRWRTAVATVAAAALPFVAFGLVNRAFGQYLLPNSVVAKTAIGSGLPLPHLDDVVGRITEDPLLIALVVLGAVALWFARASEEVVGWRAGLTTMLVAAGLQVTFADVGWFDRYQAYLVVGLALALLGVLPALVAPRPDRARLAAIVLIALLMVRVPLLLHTPGATYNVYENQYQLGRFLAAHYQGEPIAVNDIGYVGWQHDGDLVDVAGLGSIDVLRARKEGRLDVGFSTSELADHGVHVMAVYDEFFAGLVPPGWAAGGRWCMQSERIVLSSDCVTFYAPTGPDLDRLRAALREDAPAAPEGVVVSVS